MRIKKLGGQQEDIMQVEYFNCNLQNTSITDFCWEIDQNPTIHRLMLEYAIPPLLLFLSLNFMKIRMEHQTQAELHQLIFFNKMKKMFKLSKSID